MADQVEQKMVDFSQADFTFLGVSEAKKNSKKKRSNHPVLEGLFESEPFKFVGVESAESGKDCGDDVLIEECKPQEGPLEECKPQEALLEECKPQEEVKVKGSDKVLTEDKIAAFWDGVKVEVLSDEDMIFEGCFKILEKCTKVYETENMGFLVFSDGKLAVNSHDYSIAKMCDSPKPEYTLRLNTDGDMGIAFNSEVDPAMHNNLERLYEACFKRAMNLRYADKVRKALDFLNNK